MSKIKSLIQTGAISIFTLFILIARFAIPILIIVFLFRKCNNGNKLINYIENEEFENAVKYGDKYITDFIKDKDTFNIQLYLIAVTALGDNANKKGDFTHAREHYHKALDINKTTISDKISRYLTLNNLAEVENRLGNFNLAKNYYIECLSGIDNIEKLTNEEKDGIKFKIVNNLATTNDQLGNYAQSEDNYLKAIDFYKKHISEFKTEYSTALLNYGMLCYNQDNYKKAESIFLQALSASKKENSNYSNILNGLGATYVKQHKINKAKDLFLKVLRIRKNSLGNNHIEIVKPLNNLSSVYAIQKKLKKSDSLSTIALHIIENNLGKDNYYYATNLNILGDIKTLQNNNEEAQSMYIEAFDIISDLQSYELRPEFFTILNNIIASLDKQNKYMLSAIYHKKGFNPFKEQTINALSYLSEKQMIYYKKRHFKQLDFNLSFLYRYPSKFDSINVGCFENSLLLKTISLRNHLQTKKNIQNSKDKLLKKTYDSYSENKKIIAFQSQLSKKDRINDLDSLIRETERLEKKLLKESSAFANYRNSVFTQWKDVQNKLKPGEAIIDYVTFNYYNKKWTDSVVYAAFIIKNGFKVPKFITLFEEKELNKHLKNIKNNNNKLDNLYTSGILTKLFLKPLSLELEGLNTLFISPSALGNQINFGALTLNNQQTLGEKYKVHMFNSSTELIEYHSSTLNNTIKPKLILYGDINYDKANFNTTPNKTGLTTTLPNNTNSLVSRSGITEWTYLLNTEKEIITIQGLASTKGFLTKIINDKNATKSSIIKLDGKKEPFVLHLATHGFFFPDPKKGLPDNLDMLNSLANPIENSKNIHKASEDPMLRSGLIFAGANKYWGKELANTTLDNGILTAREISNLDLSACELVVMSACDTGLGDIKGSEGVYGLQRAFKMAGVNNIIMSLWKVPDQQTSELFETFYKFTFEGKNIHEAFKLAQNKMKAKYSPYYWAGFVLLE